MTEKTISLTEQSTSIATEYLAMLSEPIFLVPLLAAWGAGYIFSQSKYVTKQAEQSEKNLRVYIANAIVAAGLFNLVADPQPGTRSILTIMVASVAVIGPYIWFEVMRKDK